MGVGTGIGAFLLVHPWSIPMAVGAWVLSRALIPHTPRAMMGALVALPTLQFALDALWEAQALGVLVASVRNDLSSISPMQGCNSCCEA